MSNIVIRPIQKSDKANYLRLFNSEDFGCVGMNEDLKPSIYEEEKIVDGVIDGSIISTAILIIEDNNEFIGYTTISRSSKNSYHVGEFVIKEEKQGLVYGKRLMDELKEYAIQDDCSISLECINGSRGFFKRQGFVNEYSSSYIYPRPKQHRPRTKQLFVDYDLIEDERTRRVDEEVKSFQKFLSSPIFKDIMNL